MEKESSLSRLLARWWRCRSRGDKREELLLSVAVSNFLLLLVGDGDLEKGLFEPEEFELEVKVRAGEMKGV